MQSKPSRARPSPAMIVALIALFVALSGSAFATIDRKIGAKDIRKSAVTTKKIKKSAVKAAKLSPNSVRTPKIFDGAVLTDKLGDQAVTTPKIADLAVGALKLADQAVGTAKIADGAVSTEKIADQAVSTGKLADGAVTGAKADESTFGVVPLANQLRSVTVQREETNVPAGGNGVVAVACPQGQQALGGGARAVSFLNFIVSSRPQPNLANVGNPEDGESFTAWRAASRNTGGAADTLHVWVICAG